MKHVACDLCGADDTETLFPAARDRGPIVRCRCCRLVYQNPRNELPLDWSEAYSAEEEAFYAAQYLHEREAKREAAAHAWETLERFTPGRGRLLEVGSASGFYLEVARDRGWNVAGIEPHTPMAEWSRRELGLDVHIGTLDDAPWKEASFDAVAIYNTLEHLVSPRAALDGVARLLRPGGVVSIQVPKADNPWLRVLGRRWRHFIRYHYYFFTDQTLGRYLNLTGMDLVDARTAPKVATLAFVADRLWELHYLPRPLARPLGNAIGRLGLAQRRVRFDLRDDLLVHGRRR